MKAGVGKGDNVKASSSANRNYMKSDKTNMVTIKQECEGNVELQSMVLNTIAEYKEESAHGLQAKKSFAEMVQETTKARKKNRPDESDESDDEPAAKVSSTDDIAGWAPLRRGQLIFRDWSSKLCLLCIQHMEPGLSCHQLTNVKVDGLKQILEYILDIRVFGSKPHRCADPVVVKLFKSLQKCYDKQGKLLQHIVIDHDSGMPDWSENPMLQIQSQEGKQVTLVHQKYGQVARTATLKVEADDEGPWAIQNNFSMHMATVNSSTHSCTALSIFPEKAGATGGIITAEEHEQTKKDAKPKARAKQTGTSSLTPTKPSNSSLPGSSPSPSAEDDMKAFKWIDGRLCKMTVVLGQETIVPSSVLTMRERFQPGDSEVPWDDENDVAHPNYPEDHNMAALRSRGTGKSTKGHNRGVSSASGLKEGGDDEKKDDETKDEEHDVKGGEKEEKNAEVDEDKEEEDPEPPNESQL